MSPAEDPTIPTEELWRRYRATGDTLARSCLLDRFIGLVHHHARELARSTHGLELDELVSAGTIGMVHALEGFDPDRGLAFSTYAMPRIRGAMLDELRTRDWTPRGVRERRRRIEATRADLQQRLGRAPTDGETAEAMGLDLRTYWQWSGAAAPRSRVELDRPVASEGADQILLHETVADSAVMEAGERLVEEQTLDQLCDAMGELPERERLVLSLYYFEELNLKQIGEVLHVTESRVSQIRTQALKRLRLSIQNEEGAS